jgi:hypothetical protein
MLTVLAEHHALDGEHSYFMLHNESITWGIPGDPQLIVLHLKRDPAARTFSFDHATLPLPTMAQSWLIARGCPPGAIRLPRGMATTPADDATRALEDRLRSDGDDFALLVSYTHDSEPMQTTVLLRSLDEQAALPFRVLLEEVDTDTWTHTLREGGFATFKAATDWWEQHWAGEQVPLPTTPAPTCRTLVSPAPALPTRPSAPRGPSR